MLANKDKTSTPTMGRRVTSCQIDGARRFDFAEQAWRRALLHNNAAVASATVVTSTNQEREGGGGGGGHNESILLLQKALKLMKVACTCLEDTSTKQEITLPVLKLIHGCEEDSSLRKNTNIKNSNGNPNIFCYTCPQDRFVLPRASDTASTNDSRASGTPSMMVHVQDPQDFSPTSNSSAQDMEIHSAIILFNLAQLLHAPAAHQPRNADKALTILRASLAILSRQDSFAVKKPSTDDQEQQHHQSQSQQMELSLDSFDGAAPTFLTTLRLQVLQGIVDCASFTTKRIHGKMKTSNLASSLSNSNAPNAPSSPSVSLLTDHAAQARSWLWQQVVGWWRWHNAMQSRLDSAAPAA